MIKKVQWLNLVLILISSIIIAIDFEMGSMVLFLAIANGFVMLLILNTLIKGSFVKPQTYSLLIVGTISGTTIYAVINQIGLLEYLARSYGVTWGAILAYAVYLTTQTDDNIHPPKTKRKQKSKRSKSEILNSYKDGDIIYDLDDILSDDAPTHFARRLD